MISPDRIVKRYFGFPSWNVTKSIKNATKSFKVALLGSDIMELIKKYKISDNKAILYLRRNNKLLKFLLGEAYEKIRQYFPNGELILDYQIDPEDGFERIILYIGVKMRPKEAYNILKQLDKDWWIKRASEYSNLCITLRFL